MFKTYLHMPKEVRKSEKKRNRKQMRQSAQKEKNGIFKPNNINNYVKYSVLTL